MLNQDTQQPMQSLNDLLDQFEPGYHMEAVAMNEDGEYDAFICTKHGNYFLGSFKTKEAADRATQDAKEAKWNG